MHGYNFINVNSFNDVVNYCVVFSDDYSIVMVNGFLHNSFNKYTVGFNFEYRVSLVDYHLNFYSVYKYEFFVNSIYMRSLNEGHYRRLLNINRVVNKFLNFDRFSTAA